MKLVSAKPSQNAAFMGGHLPPARPSPTSHHFLSAADEPMPTSCPGILTSAHRLSEHRESRRRVYTMTSARVLKRSASRRRSLRGLEGQQQPTGILTRDGKSLMIRGLLLWEKQNLGHKRLERGHDTEVCYVSPLSSSVRCQRSPGWANQRPAWLPARYPGSPRKGLET